MTLCRCWTLMCSRTFIAIAETGSFTAAANRRVSHAVCGLYADQEA